MSKELFQANMKELKREYKPFDEWLWRNYDGRKKVNIDEFVLSHLSLNTGVKIEYIKE